MNLLQEKLDELERMRLQYLAIKPIIDEAEAFILANPDGFKWAQIVINDLQIAYSANTVDEAKQILKALVKTGRKAGKMVDDEKYKTLKWDCGGIDLIVYLNTSNPMACKWVETGTKTVPVYELQCGGVAE